MQTPHRDRSERTLLTLLVLSFSVTVGLIAAILHVADGGSWPSAIQYGCGAFAATVLFVFGVISFWRGRN